MARVITFAKTFPNHHPRAGEPTHFKDSIVHYMSLFSKQVWGIEFMNTLRSDEEKFRYILSHPKVHTIRKGERFKAGDIFSPREWSGRPYHSKQHQFMEVTKVQRTFGFLRYKGRFYMAPEAGSAYRQLTDEGVALVARNDGLTEGDFRAWFDKDFNGQVIVFGSIDYGTLFKLHEDIEINQYVNMSNVWVNRDAADTQRWQQSEQVEGYISSKKYLAELVDELIRQCGGG